MCSWGPVVLGHHDPEVEAAAEAQRRAGDTMNGPAPVLVELAEHFTALRGACRLGAVREERHRRHHHLRDHGARRHGRRKLLVARGAYHGAAPWCTPNPAGVTPEDRAHLLHYRYNDIDSLEQAAAQAGDDLAGVLVSPFRHDYGVDQELPTREFAQAVRALCDRTGAALILDEVRAGGRLDLAGSWEALGVRPDLAAWSKAIANGHALAAVTGNDRFRSAAASIFVTGSFWCGAVAMAASLACLRKLQAVDGIAHMQAMGQRLRDGLARQARGAWLSHPPERAAADADAAVRRRPRCRARRGLLHAGAGAGRVPAPEAQHVPERGAPAAGHRPGTGRHRPGLCRAGRAAEGSARLAYAAAFAAIGIVSMQPHLRIARPVSDLARAETQYVEGLGLQVLGRFAGHDGFDGVMLGLQGAGWHLEFTFCRTHPVAPAPTAEDLLVLYLPERDDWEQRCEQLLAAGFVAVEAFNPWWQRQGRSFACADGYRVVLQQGAWPDATDTGPVVDYDDLEAALHYTSTYDDDQRALVSRTSGEIFHTGIYGAESDLPADVGDADAVRGGAAPPRSGPGPPAGAALLRRAVAAGPGQPGRGPVPPCRCLRPLQGSAAPARAARRLARLRGRGHRARAARLVRRGRPGARAAAARAAGAARIAPAKRAGPETHRRQRGPK